MYKKLLLTMLICNLSMHASENFTEKRYNDAIHVKNDAVKHIDDRLEAIAEEEKTQYDHTNHTYVGVATGIALIVFGIIGEDKYRNSLLGAGFTITLGSGGVGAVSIYNENQKAERRKQERIELIDRKIKLFREQ